MIIYVGKIHPKSDDKNHPILDDYFIYVGNNHPKSDDKNHPTLDDNSSIK